MNATLFNVVYNRKKRLLPDGTALVQVEAYLNMKKKYFSTNIYLQPDQWDIKRRKVKNHPNAMRLNKQVSDFVAELQTVELDRRNSGKAFTLDMLSEYLKGGYTHSFTVFMQNEIEADKISTPATITAHTSTLKTLKEYKGDILFDDITFDFLTNLERYLFNKGLHTNTVNKYFRHIRKFINLAINKELFEQNKYPFRKFKPKSETTKREYLTTEELKLLENVVLPPEQKHLQKTLDMFLFSCYTGLRFSDTSALAKDAIRVKDDGMYIELTMRKTTTQVSIPVYLLFKGKAIPILNKYIQEDRKYIFDDLTNQYVNRCLKDIAKIAGIGRKITFHTSRHTMATLMLGYGVPTEIIQNQLGHAKIQTTQIYSQVMNKTVINALQAAKFE